ncbi:MAG: guanine deaminase [Pseudomonadaceae bacterium]|nr:guanine deaminase [Pseudomonadaceae bacterium]
MAALLLRGEVLSFSGDTPPDGESHPGVNHLPDAVVRIDDGTISAVVDAHEYQRDGGDLGNCETTQGLIIPGLIDTHIHYPQMDIIGSYGSQLMEWLDSYAFPAELAYASQELAQLKAEAFLDRLFSHGTTTSLTFTSVHAHSTDALFSAASKRNVRLIAGKVLMNREAPAGLCDGPGDGIAESAALIERWHGQGRLSYAVTPRFAITCTDEQLTRAGELLARDESIYLHTHLSEHPNEIAYTLSLFPDATDYVDVYDRFGMVGARSVFAHGIHLSDREHARLSDAGSSIAFCPTSNLFLGSGLLDLARLRDAGVNMGVATDVGGGTSFSMLRTLGEGYKVAQLTGQNWHPLAALHTATTGNARILHLADKIGQVAKGFEADLTILSPVADTVLGARIRDSKSLTERLLAFYMLEEQAIERTIVNGETVFKRSAA